MHYRSSFAVESPTLLATAITVVLTLVGATAITSTASSPSPAQPVRFTGRLAIDDDCDVIELTVIEGVATERILAAGSCFPLWAPDRSRFVVPGPVEGQATLSIFDTSGRLDQSLDYGYDGSLWPISWRPDGGAISASWGEGCGRGCGVEQALVLREGEAPVPRPGYTTWSPDGSRSVLDQTYLPSDGGLVVGDEDGMGISKIARLRSSIGFPAWSPDGRRIAFVSPRHGGRLNTIGPDGSDPRALGPADLKVYRPVWSPDSSKIVAVEGDLDALLPESPDEENPQVKGLVLFDVASGSTTRLEESLPVPWTHDLEWSPDGRNILVAGTFGGDVGEAVVIPADGGPGWRVPGTFASWSPDGRWVAVMTAGDDGFTAFSTIEVLSQEGQSVLTVHRPSPGHHAPVWLP